MKSSLNQFKQTLFLRLYTFMNIPLIWWIQPSVVEVTQNKTVLKIPLTRRTRNHLKVMYFGALAVGAEVVVALKAVDAITHCGHKVDYIFKDFTANFAKRAEGDVHFICEEGAAVEALVKKCLETGDRESQTFHSYAIVPSKDPSVKVAEFSVTLSVKKRK